MTATPLKVSSAGESPSASDAHHYLFAGLLIDAESRKALSVVELEEVPDSGLDLNELASGAKDFLASVAEELKTAGAVERALKLYLEQQLTSRGHRHSEVVARVLERS